MIHKKQKQKTALFLVQVIVIIINTLLFAAVWYGYYKSRMWGNTFYGKRYGRTGADLRSRYF